jgi:hypothetical protein
LKIFVAGKNRDESQKVPVNSPLSKLQDSRVEANPTRRDHSFSIHEHLDRSVQRQKAIESDNPGTMSGKAGGRDATATAHWQFIQGLT